MERKLRQVLSLRQKKRIIDDKLTESAVLVPLFYKEGKYHVLFTQRSDQVAYHKGQISFPGGARSQKDLSLLDTALRESWEEIGLEAKDTCVLGELDDTITPSGFIISPFVALIPYPYEFKKSCNEINEIFDVPLSALMDKANFRQEYQIVDGDNVLMYFYEYEGRMIWGATARIVKQLLEVLSVGSAS